MFRLEGMTKGFTGYYTKKHNNINFEGIQFDKYESFYHCSTDFMKECLVINRKCFSQGQKHEPWKNRNVCMEGLNNNDKALASVLMRKITFKSHIFHLYF